MFKKVFFYTKFFLISLGLWSTLSYSKDFNLLLLGACLSLIFVSVSAYFDLFLKDDFDLSIIKILKYCFFLLINVLKSTFEMVSVVLEANYMKKSTIHKININSRLKKYQKIMIANLITMTPGTFVISVYGNDFLVHFIDKSQIESVTNLCYNLVNSQKD